MREAIAISLGAIAGSLSRYYFGVWLSRQIPGTFPYDTLLVNLTGCLAMGFFFTVATERVPAISSELRLLVAVGFLGSYTTFSTFSLDTLRLFASRNLFVALGYWLGSAGLGVVGVQLGSVLARLLY